MQAMDWYWIFFFIMGPIGLGLSIFDYNKADEKMYVGEYITVTYILINIVYSFITVLTYINASHMSDPIFGNASFFLYIIPLFISVVVIVITWIIIIHNLKYIYKNYGNMLSVTVDDQNYTGKEIYLTNEDLIVKDGDNVLKPGINYTIIPESYQNNIDIGTASVNIRLDGDYWGYNKVYFKII